MMAELLTLGGLALCATGWVATAQRAAALRHRLRTDALTGLANRDALADAVRHIDKRAGAVGLLLADLDGFKAVNDVHGHDVGNRLLRYVARRMLAVAHPGELVVRLHGDEFAVSLGALPSGAVGRRAAAARAARFAAAVAAPMEAAGRRLVVTASIGAAVLPAEVAGMSALLAKADRAMYRTKRALRRSPAAMPAREKAA